MKVEDQVSLRFLMHYNLQVASLDLDLQKMIMTNSVPCLLIQMQPKRYKQGESKSNF